MPISVDEQRAPPLCENLSLHNSGREDVAIPEVTDLLRDRTSWIVLIDGWISQQDTQLSFFGQRHVYGAHSTIKFLMVAAVHSLEIIHGISASAPLSRPGDPVIRRNIYSIPIRK